MLESDLIERLLAQNEQLIAGLLANQPVEVIRALNPPTNIVRATPEPWASDAPPASTTPDTDPWGDPDTPIEALLAMGKGWVGEPDPSRRISSDLEPDAGA